MKRLGQHFLKNKSALRKIVRALDLCSGETIIEIGAGHGELTEELRFSNYDLRIITIEKDEWLAENLRSKIYDLGIKNVNVITGDVLKILKSLIINLKSYKLVGNIPYYLTGRLLRIIGELSPRPKLCVFTIQKEVAERITAGPPRANKLAASVQFWAEPEIIGFISKKYFQPMPKVDSAIISLAQTGADYMRTDAEKYYKAVHILFRQPRKTILNNLKIGGIISKKDTEEILQKLSALGVSPQDRPQNLNISQIKELSTTL